jgi:hypothetical protein
MADEKKKYVTNREFFKTDKHFISICEDMKIDPTKRQASKFRRKEGTAYKGR